MYIYMYIYIYIYVYPVCKYAFNVNFRNSGGMLVFKVGWLYIRDGQY